MRDLDSTLGYGEPRDTFKHGHYIFRELSFKENDLLAAYRMN